MRVNLCFNGGCAGHGSLFAHQRGYGTQRKPGHIPRRAKNRRAHTARGYELVKMVKMGLLMLCHFTDEIGCFFHSRYMGEDGKLTVINTHRAMFACMVDADHFGNSLRCGCRCRLLCGFLFRHLIVS